MYIHVFFDHILFTPFIETAIGWGASLTQHPKSLCYPHAASPGPRWCLCCTPSSCSLSLVNSLPSAPRFPDLLPRASHLPAPPP